MSQTILPCWQPPLSTITLAAAMPPPQFTMCPSARAVAPSSPVSAFPSLQFATPPRPRSPFEVVCASCSPRRYDAATPSSQDALLVDDDGNDETTTRSLFTEHDVDSASTDDFSSPSLDGVVPALSFDARSGVPGFGMDGGALGEGEPNSGSYGCGPPSAPPFAFGFAPSTVAAPLWLQWGASSLPLSPRHASGRAIIVITPCLDDDD